MRVGYELLGIQITDGGIPGTQFRDLAARFARVLPSTSRPLQSEGAGNAGCPLHPQPRVHCVLVERTRVTTSTPESPGIPRAMVLRFPSCSPRRSGSFATVTGGIASTDLTPASRCQDHTTSPSASAPFVRERVRVHRIPPRAGDVAQRPSSVGRDGYSYSLICISEKQKYFCRRGWTGFC